MHQLSMLVITLKCSARVLPLLSLLSDPQLLGTHSQGPVNPGITTGP